MPKYLFQVKFVGEGIKGLLKDGGSKRRAVTDKFYKSLGAASMSTIMPSATPTCTSSPIFRTTRRRRRRR